LTAPRLTAGAWLRRSNDRWDLVHVTNITPPGLVHIELLDGTRTQTSIGYLRRWFERADDDE
jgi:hypothetical protein